MAFDKRGYYYRSRRSGGKVVRDYFGNGAIAEYAALLLEESRRKRRDNAQERQARHAKLQEADELLSTLEARLDLVASGLLVEAGFFRHDRGRWARRSNV